MEIGSTLPPAPQIAPRSPAGGGPRGGEEIRPQPRRVETAPTPPSTEAERRELEALKRRDREVRAHEQAHLAAAGRWARGGARFETRRGPDGREYAVGGEVQIDTGAVPGDPRATLAKAQQIRAAALAPAQPSSQDRAVAAAASRMETEARAELAASGEEPAGTPATARIDLYA